MTQQFLRQCRLVVADRSGKGLDLSQLRIGFRVIKGAVQTPNAAQIRVYNLSAATVGRIQGEFTQIQLDVGYEELGTIFKGQVKQTTGNSVERAFLTGRESPVDTFLDIFAADSDEAHNYAVVSQTLAAGHTPRDVHAGVCTALDPYGIKAGDDTLLPTDQALRGRVLYGMARDHMRTLADTHGMDWSMQDGTVDLHPRDPDRSPEGTAIALNPNTGLIEVPEMTEGGLMVRALINPKFRVNSFVKIDRGDINVSPYAEELVALNYRPEFDPQGVYSIRLLTHQGDTRGRDWYSQLVCMARSGAGPVRADIGAPVGGQ